MTIPFVSIKKLIRDITYKIMAVEEVNHAYYGIDQLATVCTSEGTTYRIHLPRKYISRLTAEELAVIKNDVAEGRNPYFIYREKLLDNTYCLDIIDKNPAIDDLYENGVPVPKMH